MKKNLLLLIMLLSVVGFSTVMADETPKTPGTSIFNDRDIYYISSNGTRVRALPATNGKILGELSLNDKVRIINPSVVYDNKFIEVNIVLTYDQISKSEKYFISTEFLSPKIVDYKEFVGRNFVVLNVATETLRVYERTCMDNSCPSKMIMETEVVVGEDVDHPKDAKGKGRSILGSYRITGWAKFYQDPEGHYPAWYRADYPELPVPDAAWNDWFSKKVLPVDENGKREGKMRGAFGWYTAFAAPHPYGQWTHGTLGWGSDKDKFIKKVKKALINVVSDPRSSGCTRNNNEAIAYIRKLIDIGAPLIKIYAKEEILDPTYSNYPNEFSEWKYVLTKNRNHAIDRSEVLKNLKLTDSELEAYWELQRTGGGIILDPNDPLNQVLEAGTYQIDVHPDAIEYTPAKPMGKFGRKIGRKGNVYGVKDTDIHGKFYVDAGVLEGYTHPDSILETGGFDDEVSPSWMALSNIRK
ncbi:MAG: L,D-transpeptidase family protein [Bacteriovorax sp.]|jgi:hypothetical protein